MGVYVISDGSPVVLNEPLPWPDTFHASHRLLDGGGVDPDDLYRKQPEVRKVVDFIARNVAQLGLLSYRRVSDTDRVRLEPDHPLVSTMAHPRPLRTQFDLVSHYVHDLALWDRALLAKVRDRETGKVRLYRLPPRWWRAVADAVGNVQFFRVRGPGAALYLDLKPEFAVYASGYAPCSEDGIPPVETLQPLLIELQEGASYRGQMWNNNARIGGWIERPTEAPDWSDTAWKRFSAQWSDQWAGAGTSPGGTPLLEDGMKFHAESFDPKVAEYVEGRRLTLLEVATSWHVQGVMVGHSEQATYSNLKEFRSMLYTETLGPVLVQLEQVFGTQLVPDFPDVAQVYVEFNVEAKLRGNFEEQAAALQSATGAPWMLRSEARARMNLPEVEGADLLVVPLNVLEGGQASPRDSVPTERGGTRAVKAKRTSEIPGLRDGLARDLGRHYAAQRREVMRALDGKAAPASIGDAFDHAHWSAELGVILRRYGFAIASAGAAQVLAGLGDVDDWSDERMLAYVTKATGSEATSIVTVTGLQLIDAVKEDDWKAAAAGVFARLEGARSDQQVTTTTTEWANFGRHDAARVGGRTRKVWRVTSGNPRASHAALSDSAVDVDAKFGNGARWPGDSSLTTDERAGCTCRLDFEE